MKDIFSPTEKNHYAHNILSSKAVPYDCDNAQTKDISKNKETNSKTALQKLESNTPTNQRIERWLRNNEKYQSEPESKTSSGNDRDSEDEGSPLEEVVQQSGEEVKEKGSEVLRDLLNSQLKASEILLKGSSFEKEDSLKAQSKPVNKLEEFLKNRIEANEQILKGDHVRCEKCHEVISVWDVPEHDDFHFAKQLQKEQYLGACINKTNDNIHNRDIHGKSTTQHTENVTKCENKSLKRKKDFASKKEKFSSTLDSFVQKKSKLD